MRQGNGSDLLGVNDPRSANIGIIYVSPTDDRKSVLAAILTQEKLGRKQVAVALPTQNKAFQRPADFDDLRSLRRKLQSQLVFIAPGGPGPAEFARQRRFIVYSSLDNYASALRDQEPPVEQKKKKVYGLFGSSKYKSEPAHPAGAAPEPPLDEEEAQSEDQYMVGAGLVPARGTAARDDPAELVENRRNGWRPAASAPADVLVHNNVEDGDYEEVREEPIKSRQNGWWHVKPVPADSPARDDVENGAYDDRDERTAPAIIGGVAAGVAFAGVNALYSGQARPTPHLHAPYHAEENVDNIDAMSVADVHNRHNVPQASNDDNALSPSVPISETARNPASVPASSHSSTPEAIDLQPVRSRGPRSTLKLQQRDDDAILAAGAVAGAAAAGSAVAVSAAQAHQSSASGQPPTRGTMGRGGGGSGPRQNRPRRPWWIIALLLLAVLLVLFAIFFSLANAYPKAFSLPSVPGIKASSPATVTITPDSKVVGNSYVVLAVTNGTPNPDQRQIAARTLSSQPQTQTKTVNGTGHNQVPAATARGTLTFTNGSTAPFTVAAGTPLQAANGATIVTNVPAVIPAANTVQGTLGVTSVSARATAAGANGNLSPQSVSGTCCAAGNFISVRNNGAFTGGVDAKDYNFVLQSDVDAFVSGAKAQLTQQANSALTGQLKSGEQLAQATDCPATARNSNPVGDQGVNIPSTTVTVSVTCQAEAYDQNGMRSLVTNLLQEKAKTDAGSDYALQGNDIIRSQVQQVNPDHSVSLLVSASGLWVYQFSNAQKQQLAKLIAGKTVDAAKTLLTAQVGVHDATISTNNSVLPTDPSQISIVVQGVPSLQDTGTPFPLPTPGNTSPGGGTGATAPAQSGRGDSTSLIGFGMA